MLDEELHDVARRLLAIRGWSVAEADGAPAALLALTAEHFDVVLLDLAMPGTGGAVLLGRLRAQHPSLALVVMSGAVAALGPAMPDAFVPKPFSGEALERGLAEALGKRRAAIPAS